MAHYTTLAPALLVTIILTTMNPTLADTQQLIDKICRQMEEYGFCNKTFHDNLPSPTTDIVGLTKITIDQVRKNATSTHDLVLSLLKGATDPAFKNALVACENAYHIVINSFNDGFKYFNTKDYRSMVDSERIAPRAQASCDVSFKTPPFPKNPLEDRNRQARILIAMAVVTGHELSP